MWKIVTAASTALVLLGTPALAQWDEADIDDDGFLSQEEFDGSIDVPGLFNDIDLNDDDQIGEEEFGEREGLEFGEWDEDESGFLSEDEFGGGLYDVYDMDDDDMWDEEEFGAYEDDGWF